MLPRITRNPLAAPAGKVDAPRNDSLMLDRASRRRCIALTLQLLTAAAVAAPARVRAQPATEPDAKVTPPVLKTAPPADWPGEPRRVEARVAATVVVGVDGTVGDVELDPGADPELLDAARANLKLWRFEPAKRDGQAVAAKVRVEVVFPAAPAPVPPVAPPDDTPPPGEPDPPPPAEAAEPRDPPPAPAPAPPIDVGAGPGAQPEQATEVRVRGERHSPPPRSASDFDIEVGQLRDVPRQRAEQMLTLAPGFFLTNHSGDGHPSAIFLRGFDAAEGQDIEFSVDGVPVNDPSNAHGHGYADTLFVIPELVQRLRVVEGPFDPRQGDFAVAGSVEYELGLEQRGVTTQVGYGSYDAKRLVALWGPPGEPDGTYAAADFREGDGFGPNRAYRMARFAAQSERRLDEHTRVLVGGTGYATRYDSAGVIRGDDFESRSLESCPSDRDSQFFCFYDPNQGGSAQRFGVNARLEHEANAQRYSQQLFVATRRMRLRENFTGFITDVTSDGAQRGDGVEQQYDTTTIGARGSYGRSLDWLHHRQDVEVGYLVRRDDGRTRTRRLRRSGGVPYRTDFDNEFTITNLGGYVAGRFRPVDWFALRGGLRIDSFVFAVEDMNQPDVDRQGEREPSSNIEAFGFAIQPRVSLDFALYRSRNWLLSSVTSYGRGSRSSDSQALSDGEFAPFARVEAAETGLLLRHRQRRRLDVSTRAIAFYTRVDRDLVFDQTQGRNVLIGESNRFGALAAARVQAPAEGLDGQASVTYAEAYLPPDGADRFDLTAGVRLPYIPRWVSRIDLSARRPLPVKAATVRLAAGMSHVAARPLPLEQFGRPFFVVDASAGARWRYVELGAEVTNLLDRRNRAAEFNYPSNFTAPDAPASQLAAYHFAGAAPRQFMFTLTLYTELQQELAASTEETQP